MNRLRLVKPARLEILAEVDCYHRVGVGLGSKFLQAVEDATARALAYPLAGSPAEHRTRRVFLRDFPFARSIAQTNRKSKFMHWLIILAGQVIGEAAQ